MVSFTKSDFGNMSVKRPEAWMYNAKVPTNPVLLDEDVNVKACLSQPLMYDVDTTAFFVAVSVDGPSRNPSTANASPLLSSARN